MELIGASWIIFIKYTSYILSKLEKLKYLENLPVFFKILLVGYCIHINSVKSANEIVPYLIFYSTPWFGHCASSKKLLTSRNLEGHISTYYPVWVLHHRFSTWVAWVYKMVVFIGGLMHSWPIIMVAACNVICF